MKIPGVILTELHRHSDPRGWLTEVWRADESKHRPMMGYVSLTLPGVTRGPHEHREQADYFVFVTGDWRVDLHDNRVKSKSAGGVEEVLIIQQLMSLIVPPGVIHSYTNIGRTNGLVLNLPDRLYGGEGRREPVDEIRYEDGAAK